MKLITAIVRPEKLDELIGTLIDNRAHGLTVSEVRGLAGSSASFRAA
jgi:nitrogen regulatory protein PII